MLEHVTGCLACPYCTARLSRAGGVLRCANGHAFDVARQGYVSLLAGDAHTGTADTAEMVTAREAFLAAGHYAPLAGAVAEAAADAAAGAPAACVLDAGAGTGYYLAAALDGLPAAAGIALDLSKHAARRAARAHPRIGAVVGDAWGRLPVRDGSIAVVLDVFAPRNAAEFRRVLVPGGSLVVATPAARHLAELVEPLGLLSVDARKPERVEEQLAGGFELARERTWEATLVLTRADVLALARMGPSARHASTEETAARVAALPEPVEVTASVVVARYRAIRRTDAEPA